MASRPGTGPAPNEQLTTVDGLVQLSFLIQELLERRAAEHDVSISQTRLLGILRDRTPTMSELATLLGLDKSSATGLVDRAEQRGLVERSPSAADRRAVHVRLTRAGRALVSRVAGAFEADVFGALEGLSHSQREALSKIVSQVVVQHAERHGRL